MGRARGVPDAVYVPSRGTFRVVREVGKAFSSGGFGVSVPHAEGGSGGGGGDDVQVSDLAENAEEKIAVQEGKVQSTDDEVNEEKSEIESGQKLGSGVGDGGGGEDEEDDDPEKKRRLQGSVDDENSIQGGGGDKSGENAKESVEGKDKIPSKEAGGKPSFHVFIEEAIFLHCRGLLRVLSEDGSSELTTKDLFDLLPVLHVPLGCYLTYAHLRAQTFVVLRHTVGRGELCWRLQVEAEASEASRGGGAAKRKADGNDENGIVGAGEGQEEKGVNSEEVVCDDDHDEDTPTASSESILDITKNSKVGDAAAAPSDDMKKKRLSGWKRSRRQTAVRSLAAQLREDDARAPPPRLIASRTEENSPSSSDEKQQLVGGAGVADGPLPLAFDVYKPRSNFRKRNPGPPDFRVAVGHFAEPGPPFEALLRLSSGGNDGDGCSPARDKEGEEDGDRAEAPSPSPPIPVRLAVVADGGTVVMFALTDYGIPSIA